MYTATTDTTVFPHNDDNMVYDDTIHGYVLTDAGARALLGTDLSQTLDSTGDFNPSTMGQRVLKRISRHFYSWVYSRIPNANKGYVEYLLAKYPPCREIVQTCLENELYYNLKNGDFYNYADNDRPEWKSVSEDTRHILEDTLPNGVCLMSLAPVWFCVPANEYRVDY